jgi:hypothetical protein
MAERVRPTELRRKKNQSRLESYPEEHNEDFKTTMLCAPTNDCDHNRESTLEKEADFRIGRDRSSKNLSVWFCKNGTEFQMIDQRIHCSFERRLQ